jgi:hypothetical protein
VTSGPQEEKPRTTDERKRSRDVEMWGYIAHRRDVPLKRSIQVFIAMRSPVASVCFIIFRVSSRMVSPVSRVSITSTTRSEGGRDRRAGSLTSAMRLRKASSISIHPRSA